MSLFRQLFAKKSLATLLAEAEGDNRLKRVLGPVSLTALGVGAIIGAGIFVATGKAANDTAGPALMLSYAVAGVTCIFAALCYAEFASMAPVAGSAYTYSYATMGELFAWIIGWDLVLEYAVGAATVANGWSGYFQSVLLKVGIVVPIAVSGAPVKYDNGYLLPNMVAKYEAPGVLGAAPVTHDVTQKVLATKEKDATWADGARRPANGIYWTYTQRFTRQPNAERGEYLDMPAAPRPLSKKKLDAAGAVWFDGKTAPADGEMWVFRAPNKSGEVNEMVVGEVGKPTVEEKLEDVTVVVGAVGDNATESKLTDHQRALINLPAVLIVLLVTAVLVKGISESAGFNALMVGIKVAAVIFVIAVGAFFINPANWTRNFAPYGWTGVSFFGIPVFGQTNEGGEPIGMLAGAAIIFFAYIGFDSVSTHAEEARKPQRDVPIGIIASLIMCTILYILVVAVLTGMVSYDKLSKDAGVSDAFKRIGLGWAEFIIALAGVAGITSVLLVMMLSAPRVFLAMARDGLVPHRFFADVHPTFRTPWKSTIAIGLFVALMTAFLPIDALLHLTNIGTLFAFVVVCAAVLIMRRTNPEAARPFRCPLVPVVPILGIGCCLLLMLSLPAANWWRLFTWLGIGLVIYFCYGLWNSTLRRGPNPGLAGFPSAGPQAGSTDIQPGPSRDVTR